MNINEQNKLTPAYLDEKDVTTDWIEGIFDNCNCIWNGKSALGYVHDTPVLVAWHANNVIWKFLEIEHIEDSEHLAILRDRLIIFDDSDSVIIESSKVIGNLYWQSLYFRDDDDEEDTQDQIEEMCMDKDVSDALKALRTIGKVTFVDEKIDDATDDGEYIIMSAYSVGDYYVKLYYGQNERIVTYLDVRYIA